MIRFKEKLFCLAYERFRQDQTGRAGYDEFCRNNSWWLEDFALFTSLHRHYTGSLWSTWPDAIKYRDPAALDVMRRTLNKNIGTEKFLQYMFSRAVADFEELLHKKRYPVGRGYPDVRYV